MASMTIIPQDIITTHILCRLPAKSVGRFRCVSKEWLSLLSEPRFIQTHQKTLNGYHCIFWSNDGSLYSVPFNDHEAVSTLTKLDSGFYRIISILGSVNGVVLASTHKKMHHYYTLCVLNPTTKDYVELPSLKTSTWKQLSDSPYDDYKSYGLSLGVFANGFLHWICKSHSKPVIVAFSLADEKLNELPPPNLSNEVDILSDDDTTLVALGEKLAIFNEVKGDVWLMNEYGVHKSWTKIVVHGFNEIPMIRPMVFYDNGKVLFLTRNLLWIYDVEERTFCKSVDIPYMNIRYFVSAYAESLISPKFSRSK
ncbi:F-box associated interaction domain-containing protein [Artemisia annua]|uniref:F-box associated interaction domain-containing protein n=1 Tax=Artemisia annua TaxID=35608 RepID=A0A2U1PS50_ARTAN|nr:F-box associated interaction domain-containing protein [Artemisia annua]